MIRLRTAGGPSDRGARVGGQVRTVSRFARAVPAISTVAASAMAALPIVSDAATVPPLGLLAALGWRLLRPEMWPAWIALPLGLADDLLTGQVPGTGMASWTIVFLALDLIDERLMFRDYLLDWAIAAVAIGLCIAGAVLTAGIGIDRLPLFLPQMAMTILCFPVAERICAALDRWRLAR